MRAMTKANLEAAFAGESQAHMKYTIFAEQADKEGFPEIARLFRAIAYAERVHAANHLRQLAAIGDTAANLETGIAGESFENTEMYPAYDAVARLQDEKGALLSIRYALEAEKIHEAMYRDAQSLVKNGQDRPSASVHVCSVCGYTVIGQAPDKCPVCGRQRDAFREF